MRPPSRPIVLGVTHSAMYSGAEKDLLAVATAMRADVEYELVIPDRPGSFLDRLEQADVVVHPVTIPEWVYGAVPPLRVSWWRDFGRSVWQLRSIIRARRPVLIHCNSLKAALIALFPAATAGVPLLLHQHDILAVSRSNRAVLRLLRPFVRASIAVSKAVRDNLLALSVPAEQVAVAYNFLYGDPPEVCSRTKQDVRTELGVADDDLLLLSASQIAQWKGIDVVIRAFSSASEQGLKGVLLIAGSPYESEGSKYLADLRALVTSRKLDSTVRFLGYRADIPCLVASSDIFVHAAVRADPFPLSVIEALSGGVFVIGSAGGGVPEVVRHEVSGLLAAPGSDTELAQQMLRAASDPELRASCVQRARALLAEEFDGRRNFQVLRRTVLRAGGIAGHA